MVIKLLLGELKKKRMQTAAMILMLGVALAFLIVSVQVVYSSTAMIQDFVEVSNMSSVITWKDYDSEDIAKLERLKADKSYINNIDIYDTIQINSSRISLESKNQISTSFVFSLMPHETEYNKIFPVNEGENIELSPGEIGIPLIVAQESQIKVGDKVFITAFSGDDNISNTAFEFTVKYIFKDALFGNSAMSSKRLVMEKSDLSNFLAASDQGRIESFICVDLNDNAMIAPLIAAFTEYDMNINYQLDEELQQQIYATSNGIIAIMFLVVALFIGFISFIIQRYSVHSTIEDEYSNIGFMKATGFQNKQIIGIYLNKYVFIGFCGLLVGTILGLTISKLFLSNHFAFLVITNWFGFALVTILCIVVMGIAYPIISYLCLSKIRKLSPIEMKDNRESKNKTPLVALSLYKTPKVSSKLILAINEFLQNFRHFLKIIVTLLICFALLLTVSNLKTTVTSDEDFIHYIGLTVADIYIGNNSINVEDWSKEGVYELIDKLNMELQKNNEPVVLAVDFNVAANIIDENGTSSWINAKKSARSTKDFKFITGLAPIKENEIALTNVLAARYNKEVGDTITLQVQGIPNEYTITAINQAMYNMGELILLADNYQVKNPNFGLAFIAFVDSEDKQATITELQAKYPFLQGLTAGGVIKGLSGNFIDQLTMACNLLMIFIVLFAVIMSIFFNKMLCFKDSALLAKLHSIGANNSYLFHCQMIKFGIIAITATLFGVLGGIPVGRFIVMKLFSFTGIPQFILITNPINTFIVLPALFLIIVLLVSAIIQGQYIKNQSFKKEL